jgi:hypothetical protein
VEGYQPYYFEGTLWWKAIRPIMLRYFMVEGYQTYYFKGTKIIGLIAFKIKYPQNNRSDSLQDQVPTK